MSNAWPSVVECGVGDGGMADTNDSREMVITDSHFRKKSFITGAHSAI